MFSQARGGTFTNTGTITKSAGSGITSIFGGAVFNNEGTLSVDVGEWCSDAGGTSSGTFALAAGTTLGLFNHTLTEDSEVTSAGAVELGNVAVGGDYAVTGSTTVHGGLTDFTGTVASVGI